MRVETHQRSTSRAGSEPFQTNTFPSEIQPRCEDSCGVQPPPGPDFGMHLWRHLTLALLLGWGDLRLEVQAASPTASPRPNIVLILADDLGYGELGCYGQQKIRTPNIDRLSREGMRFTQHYSGAPVCAPSRCVLLTGLHTGHAQIRGNKQMAPAGGVPSEVGQQPITNDALTLAEVLQQAGYATGAMGKWGLGPVGSSGAPHKQGFDLFFGYNCQSVAHSAYPPYLWRNDTLVPLNTRPIPGHAPRATNTVRMEDWIGEIYAPERMTDEAVGFLRDHRSKPFFLYLPFIEPHVAMHPPKQAVEEYPADWDREPYRGQCGYLPHPRPHAAYAAMISTLDAHVGRVLQTLDELGLTENTLVIFTSDNGTTHPSPQDPVFGTGGVDAQFFNSTAGLRGFKGSVHEGGIRVPLLVRWPGRIKPGSVQSAPSYFADHFPTLCAAARLATPRGLDGVNLLPLMTGQRSRIARNPMVWVFPEYGGQVAVRIGDLKVVRKGLKSASIGDWEVYDLAQDLREETDVAKAHPRAIERAKAILSREMLPNPNFPVEVPGIRAAAAAKTR